MTGLEVRARDRLRDLELDVELKVDGDGCAAIVGPSGAGKSTVLRIIAGLRRPDPGRVVLGEEVWLDSGRGIDLRPEELSFGERRLVALARAVATEPSVLLLDEPAAGLGEHETAELAHLVRKLADEWGMAVLLVEHDVSMVLGVCDQVSVLDFGRVIAHGDPESIARDRSVVEAYLGDETAAAAPRVAVASAASAPLLTARGLSAG